MIFSGVPALRGPNVPRSRRSMGHQCAGLLDGRYDAVSVYLFQVWEEDQGEE
jgi:hypothetical protein